MKVVLIADEDALTRKIVLGALANAEIEVVDASFPEEALRRVEQHSVDVALLDYDLVRQSPTLAAEIMHKSPQTRRIVLTPPGLTDEEKLKLEADEVLEKPLTPMNLLRCVSRLLGPSAETEAKPLHDLERQQLLQYARHLAQLRREDERKGQQLKEAHARLQEFEKMKDMFLALVSHELRTPLTAIKASGHILTRMLRDAEPGSKEEKLANVTQNLSAASTRMETLIQELLSYHAVRNGVAPFELKPADLGALVQSVCRETESLAAKKKVELLVRVSDGLPLIQGDQPRLREAIHHLVKNAIHYNVEGGRVEISLENSGDGLQLTVMDTGVGISGTQQESVFLPFYQAHDVLTRRVEGVGLGLAITRHIVESHNGKITLAGELGKGTEVRVWLPLAPPELHFSEFAPLSPEEIQKKQPTGSAGMFDYSRELYAALEAERVRRRHLEDKYRAMEGTFLETLTALMRQIDLRGAHKGSHVERVILFANEIARRIDPTLPDNRDFQLSLLLHDIGKIGVAESLLQKVGSLDPNEQKQVQAHVAIGTEILGNIHFLEPAIQTVRHHHERWDGKGYPDGLAGAQIPLWARIISVADSFDAMTQDRPYRKALDPAKAMEEIQRMSGSQYDPTIVQAFVEGWESITNIATKTEEISPDLQEAKVE
ncbi:HD domain-containing protein [bacterium]|nr:HD domain-containing protein [bacterium]